MAIAFRQGSTLVLVLPQDEILQMSRCASAVSQESRALVPLVSLSGEIRSRSAPTLMEEGQGRLDRLAKEASGDGNAASLGDSVVGHDRS